MQIYVEKDIEPSAPKSRNDKANAGLTQRNRNVVATTFQRMKKGMAGGLGKGSKSVHSEVAQEGSSKSVTKAPEQTDIFRQAPVASSASLQPSMADLFPERQAPVQFEDSHLQTGEVLHTDLVWDGQAGSDYQPMNIFRETCGGENVPRIEKSTAVRDTLGVAIDQVTPKHLEGVFRSNAGDGPTLQLGHPIAEGLSDPSNYESFEEDAASVDYSEGGDNSSRCSIEGIGFLSDSEIMVDSDIDKLLSEDDPDTQVLFTTDNHTNLDNDSMFLHKKMRSIHSFFSVSTENESDAASSSPQRNSRAAVVFGIALGVVAYKISTSTA